MADDEKSGPAQLLNTPNLSDALESDRFKQFLDHVPFAVIVSELQPTEKIAYANLEFERLSGQAAAEIEGKSWTVVPGKALVADGERRLNEAIVDGEDYLGTFTIDHDEKTLAVYAWSNIIEDDDGAPVFRIAALAEILQPEHLERKDLQQSIQEKDMLLRELQHRVKNNLQMITALIRLESRNLPDEASERFSRLAGRIEALALLYHSLAEEPLAQTVDLGVYLSQIASAVMRAHAVEGIRLDLQVDTWPVSVNVAMPAGLVVNELLTNALKHAFVGRDGGTITLHSLVDDTGCRVTIADDGVGLAEGVHWPQPGKLGMLIVKSLRENAKAHVEIQSERGNGLLVTIFFERADAAPKPL
ncbi:MAG: sensor histidine kinase [Methylovirgula sp.]